MDEDSNTDRQSVLQPENRNGINSDQRTEHWPLVLLGSCFFATGAVVLVIFLPDAIRDGDYGVLFCLLFLIAGAGFLYQAFKIHGNYRRFGSTQLFLDPGNPGVGGQLGGRFSLIAQNNSEIINSTIPSWATLACIRKSKGGRRSPTTYVVLWQENVPVYLKQVAHGVDASFLIDIPKTCTATKKLDKRSFIMWKVTVEADFSSVNPGKFERSWEVVVGNNGSQSHEIDIPQSFLERAAQQSQDFVEAVVLEQVSMTEDSHQINVHSKAARASDGGVVGMGFGAISIGVGFYMASQNSIFGYLFILLGAAVFFFSLYRMGKIIDVSIDKQSWELKTQESFFGYVYAEHQGGLFDADKLGLKKVDSRTSQNKKTEYFAVEYEANGKTIRIADEVVGEDAALALMDAVVERCSR
ncbi:hypothetical protein [Granulosicoccus antarcticus]|uniref:DUF3592 domain-containing protein n=1 Tax=Granulosicoccus antarcticus IMCC3135 TaxID=1192854 RepID=A0A2Z2P1N6_9GAMM|nr:hypothetical protein [Granulosicoccus antarcticus]ASJ73524.1 hypothetical protein IMCC3135_17210 [Granulosicoccus antarcticus IMCC3135]